MTERGQAANGIDTSKPNVARIYDYLLGGKDNFAVDRAAAQQLIAATPDTPGIVRDNRSFIGRAVRFLAEEAGIRQFVDLGGGLPTQLNVDEMVHSIAPDAHVVYVDNDPVVFTHGQALLACGDGVAMVCADLRAPADVLQHAEVRRLLDLAQPVAIVCTSVLHFIPGEDDPHRIIAGYRDRLAPGSYLVISHGTSGTKDDPKNVVDSATNVYRQASAQLHLRSLPEITRLFDGFELVDPGVVWMNEWRPDPGVSPAGQFKSLRAGVGRKP